MIDNSDGKCAVKSYISDIVPLFKPLSFSVYLVATKLYEYKLMNIIDT